MFNWWRGPQGPAGPPGATGATGLSEDAIRKIIRDELSSYKRLLESELEQYKQIAEDAQYKASESTAVPQTSGTVDYESIIEPVVRKIMKEDLKLASFRMSAR